jgi:hypothetical protein
MTGDGRQLNLTIGNENASCRINGVIQRCWLHVYIQIPGVASWILISELPAQEGPLYDFISIDTTPVRQLKYNQEFLVAVYSVMTSSGNSYRSANSYSGRIWVLQTPGTAIVTSIRTLFSS